MRSTIVGVALALLLALPAAASADYRTGNHWVVAPKAAASILRSHGQEFRGGVLSPGWHQVNLVRCKGDAGPAYDVNRGRGLYHHLWCAASLYGESDHFATFDLWWTGQNAYRTSNLEYPSYS